MWFSVTCLGFRVSVVFRLMFVHYTLSSVKVDEWPPFGKLQSTWSAICYHCILSICNSYLFPAFGFKSWIWFLIAPAPVHYFSVTFGQSKWESRKKRRKDNRLILLYKCLKGKARISTGDLIQKTR